MKRTFNYTVEISDEAKFLAQDMDGEVWEYEEYPSPKSGYFNHTDDYIGIKFLISTGIRNENWEETLIDLSINDFEIVDGVLKAVPKHENEIVPFNHKYNDSNLPEFLMRQA